MTGKEGELKEEENKIFIPDQEGNIPDTSHTSPHEAELDTKSASALENGGTHNVAVD